MRNFLEIVSGVCLLTCVVGLRQVAGTKCTMEGTGAPGMCTPFANCRIAKNAACKGILPQKCEGGGDLVCCSETCPPFSRELISQQQSGSRAADYCLEIYDELFPCRYTRFVGWTRNVYPVCPRFSSENSTTIEFTHYGRLGLGENTRRIGWLDDFVTLLSHRWALCSAYIIVSYFNSKDNVFVGLDWSYSRSFTPAAVYRVKRVLAHPEYNGTYSTDHHNIALLQVDRKVAFSSRVLPACLHTAYPLPAGGLTLNGWNNPSSALLQMTMETIPREECSRVFQGDVQDPYQFCTRPANTTEGCRFWGFGEPLTQSNSAQVACTNLVVGIAIKASWRSCAMLNTRISGYIPWIESIIWP